MGLAAHPAAGQAVGGSVVDDATSEPLAAVRVLLLDSAGAEVRSAESDRSGRFDLSLDTAGTFSLRAERLGYATAASQAFRIEGDAVLEVEFRLTTRPIALPPVTVQTTARSAHLQGVGFYLRQDAALGRFFTADDIEDFRPLLVTDILRIEPSVQHLFIPGENRWAVIFRGAARMRFVPNTPCFPRLVLDGNRMSSYDMDNLVHPDDIAGMELYPSGHGAPVRYAGMDAPCGIIIIWTKR